MKYFRPAGRFTRILLLLLVMALLLSGCGRTAIPSKEAPENDVEALLAGMSLEEKVGQMMVVSFRVWADESAAGQPGADVTELNDEIRACIAGNHFGGTLLFAENCRNADQTLRLVADIQETNRAAGGVPMLVCMDQEGGNVTQLGFGTTGPGSMALAATGDPGNAKAMAAIYGEELGLLGVNTDFAPVMDVNNNPNNPIIGARAFSDTPETAAAYGIAYVEGLHSAGCIATLKHFPGHGNTDTDSHTGFPCIDSSYDELLKTELVPFQRAIDAGADMVMTAHIQFPQIETQTLTSIATGEPVFLPATMSKTILTDILRGDMGFDGVIVTDALDMAAIAENFSDADILRMTINAGVDLLLLPAITDAETFRKNLDMLRLTVRLVSDGEIDEARIDESVRRILTLKRSCGLLEQSDFNVTDAKLAAAEEGVGSAENRQTAWSIAQQALTLLKNENAAFPVELHAGVRAFILFADSCDSRVGAAEKAKQLLKAQGMCPEGAELTVMVNTADNGEECVAEARKADAVILVNRVYSAACLDPDTPDGFSTAVFDRIIEARHAEGKQVIVVSCSLPYDAARFPEADAILLTYGSGPMETLPPERGEDSAWVPNLVAGLCACFGLGEASGRLPLDLPALNENYEITQTVLFPRDGDTEYQWAA